MDTITGRRSDWDIEALAPDLPWTPGTPQVALTLWEIGPRPDVSYLTLHLIKDRHQALPPNRVEDLRRVLWVGPVFPTSEGTLTALATYAHLLEAHPHLKEVTVCQSYEQPRSGAKSAMKLLITPDWLET